MTQDQKDRFDALVERTIAELPPDVRALLDEVAVVVLDRPTPEMLRDVGMSDAEADELCGLHSGYSIIEESVEHSGELPSQIHLFRNGIVDLAGGWEEEDAEAAIAEEIRVTLLHEIGHQFGLDEDDLTNLGYD